MAEASRMGRGGGARIRIAAWALAGMLLLVPWIAMRFTAEVRWTASDFVFAAVMLLLAGGAMELFLRAGRAWTYRIGAALTVATSFLLVWVNAAVGIIGSENNHANLMYAGVLAVVVAGAAAVRLRAAGMAWVAAAAATAQVAAGGVALALRLGTDGPAWPRDVIGVTMLFAVLWLVAAALFAAAARSR